MEKDMGKNMGNFVDFILNAQKDRKLAMEFLQQENADQLAAFFKKHQYRSIDQADPGKIMEAKSNFSAGMHHGFGEDYY